MRQSYEYSYQYVLIEHTDTCLISGLNGSVLNLYGVDGQSTVDVQAGDTESYGIYQSLKITVIEYMDSRCSSIMFTIYDVNY